MTNLEKISGRRFFLLHLAQLLIGFGAASQALAVQISDLPLDPQQLAPAPLILMVWDDSASMDGEFMTGESQGLFDSKKYLFPDSAYAPAPDHVDGLHRSLNARQRLLWRSQWSGCNRLYYDPRILYSPWPATKTRTFEPADLQQPWSDPTRTGAADVRLRLSGTFFSIVSGGRTIAIPHAHYFVLTDLNGNGRPDDGEPLYLVAWQDADGDGQLDLGRTAGDDRRLYFLFHDNGNDCVDEGELLPVTSEMEKQSLRPQVIDPRTGVARIMSDREELQNFANWFSYYRRRSLAGKAVAAQLITRLRQAYVGVFALNRTPRLTVQPVRVIEIDGAGAPVTTDRSDLLLNGLYASQPEGLSPLRQALDQAGKYFDQSTSSLLGASPFKSSVQGGGCQAAHAVIISDGFWNDDYSGVGNADGALSRPYSDEWPDTLADLALWYYARDLASVLPDELPGGPCDPYSHQRMRTHAFSFGVRGVIDPRSSSVCTGLPDLCTAFKAPAWPVWPQPQTGTSAQLDDLLHAVLNGRGALFKAEELRQFGDILQDPSGIGDGWISGGGAVGDGIMLERGALLYQTRYRPWDWTGEVLALPFDPDSAALDTRPESAVWRASEHLKPSADAWDTRRLLTFGGRLSEPQGSPFRYPALSDGQKRALGSDLLEGSPLDRKAAQLLDYIRGRDQPDGRTRNSLLGDIVHSAPVLAGRTLYVGANDGMLHAFDAQTGKERFAYIPDLILSQLKMLAQMDYSRRHRYYVDASPSVAEIADGPDHFTTYLLGGLGKGGKGYYCLRLKERQAAGEGFNKTFSIDDFGADAAEEALGAAVAWEYPGCRPDQNCYADGSDRGDADMGYTFGQGYLVNANAPSGRYRPVAIFGNGYDSRSGKAVLYILDAGSGKLIRKLDTGAGDDNGLSTPALIDVDLDRRVDYVYAGDLKGNLWKFDLTSANPLLWGVAYGEDRDGNGVIDALSGDLPQPLFRAGPYQPITGRPDVMAMPAACAPGVPGYMVIFGTGKYLGESDRLDTHQQSIYGIWDYGDDGDDGEYLGGFANQPTGLLTSGLLLGSRRVIDQFTEEGVPQRVLSEWSCDYATIPDKGDSDGSSANNSGLAQLPDPVLYGGWRLDFPVAPSDYALSGERVTERVIIRGGRALVVSFAPSDQPCERGGSSWVYQLNACGVSSRPSARGFTDSQRPRRYSSRINSPPAVVKSAAAPWKDLLIINDLSGMMRQQEIAGEKWGKVFWQHNPER